MSHALQRAGGSLGPAPWLGMGGVELSALGCDTVVVYAQRPRRVRVCCLTNAPATDGDIDDWSDVPFIVENLKMPLREVWPDLGGAENEFAAAKSVLGGRRRDVMEDRC